MKTQKKKLPIEDTPVIDQDVMYARFIGLLISNRSMDFNAILATYNTWSYRAIYT